MSRYAWTAFLGACLLFLVEPMLGKVILPWFGGTPSVWATCLVFFQALLLAGYAYAHLGRRLGARRQALLHAALLVLSLAWLPVLPGAAWQPDGAGLPGLRILAMLTASAGVPYLLLSSTSPLLQAWYARATRRSPYWLYALANAGSLLALVAYPFLVEPAVPVARQVTGWSWLYGAFVASSLWCVWPLVWRPAPAADVADAGGPAPGRAARWLWLLLPAAASALLVATTNRLTLDVASVPFLWILPLALYLVSFILCFAELYSRRVWGVLFAAGLAADAAAVVWLGAPSLVWQVAGPSWLLFTGCMVLHGETARLKPAPSRLTAFYLRLAGGAAAGAVLVALVAPRVFPDFWEYPISLVAAFALLLVAIRLDPSAAFTARWRARAWAPAGALLVLVSAVYVQAARFEDGRTVATARGFYGVLRVYDEDQTPGSPMRRLRHGRILHGSQFLDESLSRAPTSYYAPGSGVALAVERHPKRLAGRPLRIAVVGLGTGTMAAWGRAGDLVRFYEIDPNVAVFARAYFTYLRDSPARVDVVMGDARLSIARDAARLARDPYDVLVLDAFSSDAIPVHLLTREAFAVYHRVLAPDGVLAVHISNRYLDLRPVVRGLAAVFGDEVRTVYRGASPSEGASSSTWMLLTKNRAFLDDPEVRSFDPEPPGAPEVVWTDDFSNLLEVLKRPLFGWEP